MAQVETVGDLQIDQDLTFQHRAWRAQRIGWWGMVLVLLAALLGVFGAGPISTASITTSSGQFQLDYERFLRFNTATSLTFHVQPPTPHSGELRLWIDRDYVNAFQIQQITPLPVHTQVAPDRVVLFFDLADASQSVEISLQLYTLQIGSLVGEVGVVDGEAVRFGHFVYP